MVYSDEDYLRSSFELSGWLPGVQQCRDWLTDRRSAVHARIRPIPFADLKNWKQDSITGDFVHDSGKFFSVQGIRVTDWPVGHESWDQPIILQNEIGFLGFIAQKINGILHLLVQAKIEPGNINHVQLSPTIQATRSNFQRVHGGRSPLYLEYFQHAKSRVTRLDQFQSEQGARFLDKLNRNLIVEIDEHQKVDSSDDHCWMTIAQIKGLVNDDNLINMDSRSVMSCLDILAHSEELPHTQASGFGRLLYESMSPTAESEFSDTEILSWLTEARFGNHFSTQTMPLNAIVGWHQNRDQVCSEKYNFSVIATHVEIGNREVVSWTQPMMRQNHCELFGFVTQVRLGTLHFLAHLKSEVGLKYKVELGPSVQCCMAEAIVGETPDCRRYLDRFKNVQHSTKIHVDVMQSEEGGRFFHEQNRNMVVQIPDDEQLETTDNFRWLTLRQLLNLSKHSNYINIQARSVLSLLDINAR